MCFSIILAPFAIAKADGKLSFVWSEKPTSNPNFNNKSIEFYLLLGLVSYLTINYFPIKSFGSFFNNFNSFGFWTMFYFISTINIKFKKNRIIN